MNIYILIYCIQGGGISTVRAWRNPFCMVGFVHDNTKAQYPGTDIASDPIVRENTQLAFDACFTPDSDAYKEAHSEGCSCSIGSLELVIIKPEEVK
jgi:hypothetical protein